MHSDKQQDRINQLTEFVMRISADEVSRAEFQTLERYSAQLLRLYSSDRYVPLAYRQTVSDPSLVPGVFNRLAFRLVRLAFRPDATATVETPLWPLREQDYECFPFLHGRANCLAKTVDGTPYLSIMMGEDLFPACFPSTLRDIFQKGEMAPPPGRKLVDA